MLTCPFFTIVYDILLSFISMRGSAQDKEAKFNIQKKKKKKKKLFEIQSYEKLSQIIKLIYMPQYVT
jgi:hypothetical protein